MGSMDSNIESQRPRLPACQLCYTRKVKCDDARPKCTPCMRTGNACYTVSLYDSEPVSREYINELEHRALDMQMELRSLEARVQNNSQPPAQVAFEKPPEVREKRADEANTTAYSPGDELDSSPNLTEGAGISFMSLLFTDSRWREQNLKLLQNLSKSSTIPEMSVQPNSLPSAEEALVVFNTYLNGSHVQNPFLLRRDVWRLYYSVFSGNRFEGPPAQISDHNMFRTFMILAIGSIRMYRSGTHRNHPYGYYLTASKHLDANLFSRGIESIQDLLLVGRFGIYHHIGTSIWELTTVCVRMCIEQGLHKHPRPRVRKRIGLLHEQLQRRVFWECYMIDRYSSITLDRPAAVADDAIEVGLPVNANDDEIDAADSSGSFVDLNSFYQAASTTQSAPAAYTETSVFLLCLRLRKITSKIQKKFQRKDESANVATSPISMASITASGKIYADLDELLSELEQWRHSAPLFTSPRSLYETQEWFDLLLIREKLLLIRNAVDLVPKRKNNIPPQDLISICLEYAFETIMKFSAMFEQKKITYTRSYFQMVFTAGLSVMYCVSVVTDHGSATIMHAAEAMEQGEKTLKEMGKDLPDALHYVAVYEALRVNVLGKLKLSPGQYQATVINGDDTTSNYMPVNNYELERQQPVQSTDNWLLANQQARYYDYDPNLEQTDNTSLPPWDIFGDSTFWDMEAGLGEYAYGDPMLLFSNITEDNV